MASSKRIKTKYPGVFYREVKRIGTSESEKVFYIVFKKDGKVFEEKVGRQFADDMTAAKASGIRAERYEGKIKSRKEIRESKKLEKLIPTFANIWEMYIQTFEVNSNSKKDISRYNANIKPYLDKKKINELSTIDIDKIKNNLLKKSKSPQTIKHVISLIKRTINFGVKNGLCTQPEPSKLHFTVPKVDNKKTESLTQEQLVALKQALDAEADQNATAFIRLALVTGMRKGALMGLRWEDIDFERGFITLRGEIAKHDKTEQIPMSKSAREILSHIEKTDSPFIFPGKDGKQRKDFRRIANRVKKNAGLPEDFRPLHGLRHAYASFLASSGKVDLYTLQKLLTHSSPQMTQRYAHLADEALKKAANVVDEII